MRVTGVKEIDAVLKGLPAQLSDKVIQTANLYAAKPLIEKAKLTAPEGPTGNLVDSIGAVKERASTFGKREVGQIVVGPRRKGSYKGFAGHLVEYGTKDRTNKRGANRGKVTGIHFMEKSFDATNDQILSRFNEGTGKALSSFMRRTIRNSST